jgi:hypothetical protein
VRLAATNPERKQALAAKLTPVLSSKACVPVKRFACRQVGELSLAESVPALAALLGDETLGDVARYALERMTDSSAGAALREAVGKLKGRALVGALNSLGERREAQSVSVLAPLASAPDKAIAAAALAALGHIGGDDAARALDQAAPPAEVANVLLDARLECAEGLLNTGQQDAAAAIYRKLQAGAPPPRARAAVLRGLLRTQRADRLAPVLEALRSGDGAARSVAAWFVAALADAKELEQLAGELGNLPAAGQSTLLKALADRNFSGTEAAALDLAKSQDAAVRSVALSVLGQVGGLSGVKGMIGLLGAAATPEEAGAAAGAIRQICARAGKEQAPALVAAMAGPLKDAAPALRVALIGLLPTLAVPESLAAVRTELENADETVQSAAFQALGAWPDLAPAEDLLKLAAAGRSDKVRDLAFRACLALAQSASGVPAAQRLDLFRKAGPLAKDKAAKAALLAALSKLRDPGALALAREYLADESAKADACSAIVRICGALGPEHKDQIVAALQAAIGATKDQKLLKTAREALKKHGVEQP